ncbi:MAG TPA: cytochrome c [Aromatoleum sp.]|uniref:c-type cytochrome n=1 Tax=Aromatoleum sp. TaxID=2307007 RepID=UPI002B4847D5|nr:cytochrome c [Aromatoleum sp.]HJV24952.1 cytochrome c [Aromatoleum sp.]
MAAATESVARWRRALICALLLAGCTRGGGIDPGDTKQVARGEAVYREHCASCHGARLEGQPEWRQRRPNGRLPAPPHDASGHTWHHPDELLINIVRQGLIPPWAPAGYESDMPAFVGRLSDTDIFAVLAYIESRWPPEVREQRARMLEQGKR